MDKSAGDTVALQSSASRQEIAAAGERAAACYLVARGYRILQRNWRSGRFAELDLVALSPDNLLVFIEVKTRRVKFDSLHPEAGYDAVDWRKRRKILIAVCSYVARHGGYGAGCRIDLVVVRFRAHRREADEIQLIDPLIEHVEQAFES